MKPRRVGRAGMGPGEISRHRALTHSETFPGYLAHMLISPHEQERLLVHVAAGLARDRRARGLRPNYPEAVPGVTSFLLQGARDGQSVGGPLQAGPAVLTPPDAIGGVPEMMTERQVEVTFPDAT